MRGEEWRSNREGVGRGGERMFGVNMYLYITLNPPIIPTKTTTYGNVLKNKELAPYNM